MSVDWDKILTKKRFGKEEGEENVYVKDIRRILYSTPFRRMQGKTQVFVLPEIDHIRNRLTHSLEVANICQEITTRFLRKYTGRHPVPPEKHSDFISCAYAASLLHDIGNPPFGHMGEYAIRQYFKNFFDIHRDKIQMSNSRKKDFLIFDGNAQGLRIVTKLAGWRENGGLRLSYSTIAAFIKYPFTSDSEYAQIKNKYGVAQSEIDDFHRIALHCTLSRDNGVINRHPVVYFVEAADDICYITTDLEDAFRMMGYNTEARNILERLSGTTTDKNIIDPAAQVAYLRSKAIDRLIDLVVKEAIDNWSDILDGSFFSLINPTQDCDGLLKDLYDAKEFCKNYIYHDQEKLIKEYKGYNVLSFLLDFFINHIIFGKGNLSERAKYVLPKEYMQTIEKRPNNHYAIMQTIVDYISGMTDNYALKLYESIQ